MNTQTVYKLRCKKTGKFFKGTHPSSGMSPKGGRVYTRCPRKTLRCMGELYNHFDIVEFEMTEVTTIPWKEPSKP